MNGEALIQNLFTLVVMAIIIEAAVMAIFSLAAVKNMDSRAPIDAARDMIILATAFFLCFKIDLLSLFRGTGFKLPHIVDVIITTLVLTRITFFLRDFMSRFKTRD